MKKLDILAIIFGLGILTGCKQKTDDPEIFKNILTEYFDGMKSDKVDLDKLKSLTTTDFVLFEDGVIWTNDSLAKPIPGVKSFKGKWTFENIRVNMDESSGDMVYLNHGDFVINDTIRKKVDFLESATFRKVDGEWKLNFLHSMVKK